MNLPGDVVLDADARRIWVPAMDARSIALVVSTLFTLFVPMTEDGRWLTMALLAGVVVPYSLWIGHHLRRTHRLSVIMPFGDLLIAAGFAALVPVAWPAIMAVVVADVCLAVVVFGRRVAVTASITAGIALLLAGLRVDGGAGTGVSGFAVSAAIVIGTVGFVNARERQIRDRYTTLVNGIDGIVWEYDTNLRALTFVSSQVETILGWTRDEWLDRAALAAKVHPDDRYPGMGRALIAGDGPMEFRVRHADGHWVWLRDTCRLSGSDGKADPGIVRGVLVDATVEHEANLALQQYVDIVEQIQFCLMVWRLEDPEDDRSVTAVQMNPAAVELLGRDPSETLDRKLVDLWPGRVGDEFASFIASTIRSGEARALSRVPFPRADGSEAVFSVRMFPLPDNCAGLVTEDVTDQHRAELALRHQAMHDALTGLPNRTLLGDRLSTALTTARRLGQSVALLVMDLDQFKEINDSLGHPMGDRMLEQVAARLGAVLRDCDTVARLGGDEFAVLLTVDADRSGAQRVAERIQDALADPFDLDGTTVQTAASIGIVLSPEHGDDAGTLIQRADIAMYNAKRGGRGWSFYAAEDDRSSLRRLALVSDLRGAIDRNEFVLHYQPLIAVRTGAVVGVEALVRWRHPEHGLLSPADFIQLAEVSGSIQPLTRWVVRRAIEETAALTREGHPLVVSVNVSARNLYDAGLVAGISECLTSAALAPHQLTLELTESELVDDPSQVMTVLSLVSDMGVRLAVDDFGTGWSSLSNLTRLPIHQVKIDRSFVSHMLDGGDDAVIVRSIVDLGHNLGLAVVAEGVETTQTLDALARLGCDEAQGFAIAHPMPPDELRAWLAARRTPTATATAMRSN